MSARIVLYYITDRQAFGSDERTRKLRLLDKIAEAARAGVDFIQLRERDLCARDLESLAREAIDIIRSNSSAAAGGKTRTSLLINSRMDVALAVGAAGVHLRAVDVSAKDVRTAWAANATPIISVSCHSVEDVQRAASDGASLAPFAPVFEKKDAPHSNRAGLEGLRQACLTPIQVLALGGVNMENAASCLQSGAAGIAGIRLFQENEVTSVVRSLRSLKDDG
jgi:thiamine-phosphate pyrophosphorylase